MMNNNYKNIIFCALCSSLLVACGPKKEEGKPSASGQIEKKQAPTITPPPPTPQAPEHEGGFTPEEELEINEDNVTNPFPG
jgi:hypothetical protein